MYLLGDIGRTKMRLAVSPDGETLGEPIIKPTPVNYVEGLQLIEELIDQSGAVERRGLCLGVSRQVWPGQPLKSELEQRLDCPVLVENDAALAGLGEAHYGAGRGCRIVTYVTVSTGVGGVKIEAGRIDENILGFEPGQQLIMINGEPKTLEDLVSGGSVERRFGRPPRQITDEQIWHDLSQYLAIGLANTLLHWSPDCLVLGGSMFKTPGFKIEVIASLIGDHLTIFSRLPIIKSAALGETNGLHGALVYLLSQS
ncbi:MAG: ROK family protein [Candidatus Vogelbacteria bacterium]|nr:ROK family protein [Candidatus Vogelbacteria bacterium]